LFVRQRKLFFTKQTNLTSYFTDFNNSKNAAL